ncbi:MAG: hypothetical protein HRT35_20935 [Algicola sp.]|nr:hypothetical protein [Algicola sp.]
MTRQLISFDWAIKNEEIKDEFQAKGLLEAKETLDVLKLSKTERIAYDQHQKSLRHDASNYQSTYILGRVEGKEEGIEIGKEEGKEEIAINLLQSNLMSIAQIAQITGLTVEQVTALKASLEENPAD